MDFIESVAINLPPDRVFAFFRDKDQIVQQPGSPVLVIEKTTPGPPQVGTRYREVVQALPFWRGEILSVLTCYQPGERLEEDFRGPGMKGHLAYRFQPEAGGTRLVQQQTIELQGPLRLMSRLVGQAFGRAMKARLQGIKAYLEKQMEKQTG